jgi:hypothetical protein
MEHKLVNNKETGNDEFKSASNYIPRAEAIVRQIINKFIYPAAVVLRGNPKSNWKEPTPEMIRQFACELPGIINWTLQKARINGMPIPLLPNRPLTESQMQAAEELFNNVDSLLIENETTGKKLCAVLNKITNTTVVLTDRKEIVVL